METSNQVKIFSKKVEKCFLTAETDCTYAQLYDFGCTLTAFSLEHMKKNEEEMRKQKEALEAANKAPEQAQGELSQE